MVNKEEVNLFCKNYYGYTMEEANKDIGYWMEKNYELKKENKELHNKIDKIKSFIITNKPVYIDQKGKPCIIDVTNDLLEMLKGDSGVDE